ncbi:MAG: N-acetyltransferase [Clostridia bacterium]|nr:N-acetyltransferase [Clostridia bacterium]
MKTIETERLLLRPWREDDAEALFEYAKDPRIGPMAGWPPHTSAENSLEVLRTVLIAEDSFAVTLTGDDRPVGSIGLQKARVPGHEDEAEVGYWIAVPFWGRGFIPEAVNAILRYAFKEQGAERVWCGHYEGNDKSRRVIEKCGFCFDFKCEREVPLLGETRVEYFYHMTKEAFEHGELSCPGEVRRS